MNHSMLIDCWTSSECIFKNHCWKIDFHNNEIIKVCANKADEKEIAIFENFKISSSHSNLKIYLVIEFVRGLLNPWIWV